MITDFGSTMRVLSSILDMAHGVLPEQEFAVTMIVRCKDPDVPAHFLIGDDPEATVAETLKKIGEQAVVVGQASGDKVETLQRMGPVAGDTVHVQITDAAPEDEPPLEGCLMPQDMVAEIHASRSEDGPSEVRSASQRKALAIIPQEGHPESEWAMASRISALLLHAENIRNRLGQAAAALRDNDAKLAEQCEWLSRQIP